VVRYFFTRGVIKGCVSVASIAASERTRARLFVSDGNSGGVGKLSSNFPRNLGLHAGEVKGQRNAPGELL
jgi:hypothetical protein